MRSVAMNALRTIDMTDHRRSLLGACLAGALITCAALSASYALSVAPAVEQAGIGPGVSVHAKNGDTPEWIIDLQTRNAGQSPVVIDPEEPSFWI